MELIDKVGEKINVGELLQVSKTLDIKLLNTGVKFDNWSRSNTSNLAHEAGSESKRNRRLWVMLHSFRIGKHRKRGYQVMF